MDTVEIARSPAGTSVLMDRTLHRPVVLGSLRSEALPRPPAVGPPFTVEVVRSEQPRVIIGGPVDLTTTDQLRGWLWNASRGGTLPLTIELGAVSQLASAGVDLLYCLAEDFATSGQALRLVTPPGSPAHQVLVLTGLDRLVAALGPEVAPAG